MLHHRHARRPIGRTPIRFLLLALLPAAFACAAQAQNLCTSPSFQLAPATNSVSGTATLATTDDPYFIVHEDFNDDGNVDLAIAELPSSTVSIWLGDGDGTFTAAPGSPMSVPGAPGALQAVQFNGDGDLDLVVLARNSNEVAVLIGDGTGAFTETTRVGTGLSLSTRLAVADFDGANGLDVAAGGSSFDNNFTVLLNDGSGGLVAAPGAPFAMPGGSDPWDLAAGSFTGSGEVDLVINGFGINGQDATFVFAGDGDGTFTLHDTVSHGNADSRRRELAVADLNGDGIDEILTARYESRANAGEPVSDQHRVVILQRDAAFDWSVASEINMGADPRDVEVADVNVDGNPDLVVANGAFTFAGNVAFGDGTLSGFDSPTQYAAGGNPLTAAVADLNNDGKPDFTIANQPSDSVTTYLNDCQIDPFPPEFDSTPASGSAIEVGDVVTGDTGTADLAIENTAPAGLSEDLQLGPCSIANDTAGGFSIDPAQLIVSGGDSATIEVSCAPAATGVFGAELDCGTSNDADAGALSWPLACRGVAPAVSVSPDPVDFGSVPVGDAASTPVSVSNSGTSPLQISGLALLGAGSPFAIAADPDNCASSTLQPGESCAFSLSFAPASAGVVSATLRVTSNAPDSPDDVSMSGSGIVGELTATPASIDFGDVDVGDDSAVEALTLANAGDAALELTSLPAPTAPFIRVGGDCAMGDTLAPGASCTVQYQFSPQSTGAAGQTLTFASQFNTASLGLEGNGVMGVLAVSPATIDFGGVAVGATSAAESVTLSNSGDGSLELSGVPAPGAPFARGGGDCAAGLVMSPGDTCTIDYVFAPEAIGVASVNTTIGSNTNDVDMSLTGLGEAADIGLDLATLAFGGVVLGNSGEATVVVVNDGNVALEVSALGEPGAPFARVPDGGADCGSVPFSVAVDAQCALTYAFTPKDLGNFDSSVVLVNNDPDGDVSFDLTGVGEAPAIAVPAINRYGLVLLLLGVAAIAAGRIRRLQGISIKGRT